LGRG
jgi:hypothetical protein